MSELIIAPTIAFSKKAPADTILNAVNPDTSETVAIKEKIVPMTQQSPTNVPRELENKRSENLAAVKNGSTDIDSINRQRYEYEQMTLKKNMTYFPDTSIVNNQVIGGTINNDIR
jgi:hypothetical protein